LELVRGTADHESFPQVVFTDANVASVGLTVAAAKAKGINVREVVVGFQFPGAWVHAERNYEGWAQWVVDADEGVLRGATIVGREAVDLLHASTVAIVGRVPIELLWHAVPSFPSMSEIYVALLNASGY
jgi:pyruvate/2-oxoglutarate dehydrogenase complex dihydrolipoamide dehydrogenase (E3) component